MSLPSPQLLLVLDYLPYRDRLALAQVNLFHDKVHKEWCCIRAKLLHQRCRFLRHLSTEYLTAILASPIRITYQLTSPDHEGIDSLFNYYYHIFDDNEEGKKEMYTLLNKIMVEKALARIPVGVCTLLMFYHNYQLFVIDDELHLYANGKKVQDDVYDLGFTVEDVEIFVLTQAGQVLIYDRSRDECFAAMEDEVIFEPGKGEGVIVDPPPRYSACHLSGHHWIDKTAITDGNDLRITIEDPIVSFCWGESTCLVTTERNGKLSSSILVIDDNKIVSRCPITLVVQMAVPWRLSYIVLLGGKKEGRCALITHDVTSPTPRASVKDLGWTFDHITYLGESKIMARRGRKHYQLCMNLWSDEITCTKVNPRIIVGDEGIYTLHS